MQPIALSRQFTPRCIGVLYAGIVYLHLCSVSLYAQEQDTNAGASFANSTAYSSSHSSEAPLYPSRSMRDQTLLAKAMDDEAQWLDTEHGKILALYRPTEAKTTHGVLILFHAAENPQLWPPVLENLRARLPRYGWETLAISLPQKYSPTIPARQTSSSASATSSNTELAAPEPARTTDSSSTNAASSSTASSFVTRESYIDAYVKAAFEFVEEKGQLNTVVLADNSSAYQILEELIPQIKQNKNSSGTVDGPLQAVVITNLQPQEPLGKAELEIIFSSQRLPIMDIFFAPSNPEQIELRELHQAVAMRKKVVDYQQVLMNTQSKQAEHDHQSYLLGRVRGFMQHEAKGTEIENTVKDGDKNQRKE
ncbi:MAG TPA: DUF3530 family protein [Cellvibrio sp.]|nr:DUF3530 family protein [Cellvibrio sp.]